MWTSVVQEHRIALCVSHFSLPLAIKIRAASSKSASVYLSLAGVGFPRYRLRPNSNRGELKFQARGARQLMPGLKLLERSLVRERDYTGVPSSDEVHMH